MATLRDKETGQLLGKVSEEDLQFLIDSLEEESSEDSDYFLDADTIEMLEEDGAPETLITILRAALGEAEGVEIVWAHG